MACRITEPTDLRLDPVCLRRGLPARNRKPESIGIAGHGRRRNQNDRGLAFGWEAYSTRNVRIAVNIRSKILGKEKQSLIRVGRILAADCGPEKRDRVRVVGKHESSDSCCQGTIGL